MVLNIRHTGIVVDDLDESLSFYRDKLGFTIVKEMVERGDFIDQILGFKQVELTTVKMVLNNNQMIELLDFSNYNKSDYSRELNDLGPTHVAFTVNDIDVVYKQLLSGNVDFISPPIESPDGYAKVAFCKAPEGTYIELVEELE